jgi:glutathione S-transferase
MKYLSVAEARARAGLRLALTSHVPGPWGEAAKALFKLRGVPFAPVEQIALAANEELVAWTGMRNAPIAIYNREPAVGGWLEILLLAERLGSGPSLLPADPFDHALALGLSCEICGTGGFGWSRRVMLMPAADQEIPSETRTALSTYGLGTDDVANASAKVVAVLDALAIQLDRQRGAGSAYLVGDRLSAVDVYWACFSQMIAPLPPEASPTPDEIRARYSSDTPALRAALDPALIAHRDRIFERHIGLPLDF